MTETERETETEETEKEKETEKGLRVMADGRWQMKRGGRRDEMEQGRGK